MADRDQSRREIARRVMRALRHERARSSVQERSADGTKPIIVAVPDDTIGSVLARASRYGERVNVVVPSAAGELFMLSLICGPSAGKANRQDPGHCDLHVNSPVGMLLSLLQRLPGGRAHCTVVTGHGQVEIREEQSPLMVPA